MSRISVHVIMDNCHITEGVIQTFSRTFYRVTAGKERRYQTGLVPAQMCLSPNTLEHHKAQNGQWKLGKLNNFQYLNNKCLQTFTGFYQN